MSIIRAQTAADGFAARLATRAGALAVARITARLLARHGDERRWRRAGLIWPLFAKG